MSKGLSDFPQHVLFHDAQGFKQLFLQIVENNFDKVNFTAKQSAALLGMSESNFYKKVKKDFDVTPSIYLQNFRLERACSLLRKGMPINTTALTVGFSEQNYFCRCFKKHYGITATEYLNILKIDINKHQET